MEHNSNRDNCVIRAKFDELLTFTEKLKQKKVLLSFILLFSKYYKPIFTFQTKAYAQIKAQQQEIEQLKQQVMSISTRKGSPSAKAHEPPMRLSTATRDLALNTQRSKLLLFVMSHASVLQGLICSYLLFSIEEEDKHSKLDFKFVAKNIHAFIESLYSNTVPSNLPVLLVKEVSQKCLFPTVTPLKNPSNVCKKCRKEFDNHHTYLDHCLRC